MLLTAKTTIPKYFYIIIMQFLHYFVCQLLYASYHSLLENEEPKLQNAMF